MKSPRRIDSFELINECAEIDYFLLEQIGNSIILLYHGLTECDDYINLDLSYTKFPYWKFLSYREQLESIQNRDELVDDWYFHVDMIHQGSLIYILSMSLECLEGTGCRLDKDSTFQALQILSTLKPKDSDEERLIACVSSALEKVFEFMTTHKPNESEFLYSEFRWIINRYIKEYFQRKLSDCKILGHEAGE